MAGVCTGLVPGIHVNNVALLVYAGQTAVSGFILLAFGWASISPGDVALMLSVFIFSTAVGHTFVNFVPSVFLGAPSEDTALSVLPGHRMLLKGRGYEAVLLAARGCLWGVVASLALLLPLRLLMGSPVEAYEKLRPVMAGILVLIVTLLIYSEKERRVATRRVRVQPLEVGGIQLLGDLEGTGEVAPWPELEVGVEVYLDGVMAKAWEGGFLLARGKAFIKVSSSDVQGEMEGEWVRVQGFVIPETRIASAWEQRSWALVIFAMSGALGWAILMMPGFGTLNWYPFESVVSHSSSMMLFPLFTGLFGLSTMILSGASRETLPRQDIDREPALVRWRQARSIASGTMAGTAVSWFPGVSGAAATVIARYLAGGESGGEREQENDKEFLVSIGAANAASTIFTVVALFVILKGRSGAAATIGSLLSSGLNRWEPVTSVPIALAVLLLSCVVAALISYRMATGLAKLFARRCGSIRYGLLVRIVIVFLLVSVLLLTGIMGLFVTVAATTMGLLPPLIGVRRVYLMGCLILPAIIILAT